MSNKPLRVREKGLLLPPVPEAKPSRASPFRHFRNVLRLPKTKRILTQTGLCLCLLGLSAAYTVGLNENATAVVAQKRELPIYSVERDDKVVAISFDASWGADKTIAILDILDAHDVKTTFFLVGGWVDKYPEMVKEIAARGHEIGNHSDTHAHMSKLSEQDIRDELRIMSDKVENLTGVRPTLFRPPYGEYNDRVVQVSRAEGYECVQW
ncbi:MAG: polysaccharide deacetylase family protein, partial [Clostridiales bacterium]|nr:polysaccharide deacetylase family protein [Clostridiales bacterium]